MSADAIGVSNGRRIEFHSEYILFAFFLAMLVVGTFASSAFLTEANIRNVMIEAAPLCIVAMGQAMVILVRGFDLSVASVMGTMAVVATEFRATSDAMIPVIVLACLALSAVIGFFNGWLVTKQRVSPFLATLATMIVLQGIRFVITEGAPSGTLPPGFRVLGTGDIAGLPVSWIFVIGIAVALWLVCTRTRFGRSLYLVGGNPRAARLSGINNDRVVILSYVICACCACLAGLILTGYTGSIDNFVGRGYELQSVVAAVMGGVALAGGRGSPIGALIGALVLATLFNVVLLVGYPVEVRLILQGLIIIVASALYARRAD